MARKLTKSQIAKMRAKYLLPSTMTYFSDPVNIVRGEMQYVYDDSGKRYLDAFSAVVTISVGHCHPDIVPRVQEQVGRLQHMTTLYFHPTIALYAEKMAKMARKANPALQVSFFTNSGCEANELAALLAKNYTGNVEFLALRHSFHGRTLMAMTLTGQSIWRHSLPYVFGVNHVQPGYCYRCPYGLRYPSCSMTCATEVENVIKYGTSGKVAALLAEPIMGFGGVICPPKEYFPIVADIVRSHGGIFMVDEVQTGFGRTGDKFFGIEHWGVKPDVVTMAKGIGNGVPLGGVIATTDVSEAMRGKIHFNTYGGNPVSMEQGLAVLDTIEKYDYAKNARVVGNYIIKRLKALQRKHPIIGEIRGKGLMLGVELVRSRKTKEPAAKEIIALMEYCKDDGLLIGKGGMAGNTVRIKPPLCITKSDADFITDILDRNLRRIEKEFRIRK